MGHIKGNVIDWDEYFDGPHKSFSEDAIARDATPPLDENNVIDRTLNEWIPKIQAWQKEKLKKEDGGIRTNQAACLRCGEIIESRHDHDFRGCGCGAIAVDGGKSYTRRMYSNGDDCLEMTEFMSDPLPQKWRWDHENSNAELHE